MPGNRADTGTRSTRPLFLVVLVLAVCLLIPAFRDYAWVFGSLIVLVSFGAIVIYTARGKDSEADTHH